MMSDLVDAWKDTAPFTFARKTRLGRQSAGARNSRTSTRSSRARDEGVSLPRSLVYNELADSMHRAVQQIMLNNADIKTTLDEAAAEVDRATAAYKKAGLATRHATA